MKATTKQIGYALMLLSRAGYPTRFMSAQFKQLGVTSAKRSGSVEWWLSDVNVAQISKLIDELK